MNPNKKAQVLKMRRTMSLGSGDKTLTFRSKFHHTHLEPLTANEQFVFDTPFQPVSYDNNHIVCNYKYFAVTHGQRRVMVKCINSSEKMVADSGLTIPCGHCVVGASFSPFHFDLFATSGIEDKLVKIWRIPEDADMGVKTLSKEEVFLVGHRGRLGTIRFHPTVDSVLVSTSYDKTIKFWDVTKQKVGLNLDFDCITLHYDFNSRGDLAVTSGKDRTLRFLDLRAGRPVIGMAQRAHKTTGAFRTLYCRDKEQSLTTGFGSEGQREMKLWDLKKLSEPLQRLQFNGTGVLMPFYDGSLGIIYLAGKGERQIRYFDTSGGIINRINNFTASEAQKGICMLPKLCLNTLDHEIGRFLKMTEKRVIPIRVLVPLKTQTFQPDLFPPTSAYTTDNKPEDFFENRPLQSLSTISLDPETRPEGFCKQERTLKEPMKRTSSMISNEMIKIRVERVKSFVPTKDYWSASTHVKDDDEEDEEEEEEGESDSYSDGEREDTPDSTTSEELISSKEISIRMEHSDCGKKHSSVDKGINTTRVFVQHENMVKTMRKHVSELKLENSKLRRTMKHQREKIRALINKSAKPSTPPSRFISTDFKPKYLVEERQKKSRKRVTGGIGGFRWKFESMVTEKELAVPQTPAYTPSSPTDPWFVKDLLPALENLRNIFVEFFEKKNPFGLKDSKPIHGRITNVFFTKLVEVPAPKDQLFKPIRILSSPKMCEMYMYGAIRGTNVQKAQFIGNAPFRDLAVKVIAIRNRLDALKILEEMNMNLILRSKFVAGIIGYHLHHAFPFLELGIVMEKLSFDISQFILNERSKKAKLYQMIKEFKFALSLEQKFYIMKKMAECLFFVHQSEVIHRDIKSKNFLIRTNFRASKILKPMKYQVKLADFGLSKKLGSKDKYESSTIGGGKGAGTLFWLAPELIRDPNAKEKSGHLVEYSYQSDIYALGITFWEVLSEKRPYSGYEYSEEREFLNGVVNGNWRPMTKDVVDERFIPFLERCWTSDLCERFQNMDEVLSWFRKNRDVILGEDE